MNTASYAFGQRLRLVRERHGISLESIADSTKISRSLLADLERGDVSKWPRGIYRRAFFREYAVAIGLPADELVAEFLELCPEEGAPPAARSPRAERGSELRLTILPDRKRDLIDTFRRLAIAALELGIVVALGLLIQPFTGAGLLTVAGIIALIYYPIAAVCSIRAPAFRWPAARWLFAPSVPAGGDLIQLVLQRPPVQSADERTA